ncbi:glycine-rich domain-containing protein [Kitasatospora sp. NPDC089509]|uniref:glycine-rich domain-containing protein n=1 Tax=Kitasatospora sp. NPDC089509 TaxID=3364079 RepID=UPI00382FCD3F
MPHTLIPHRRGRRAACATVLVLACGTVAAQTGSAHATTGVREFDASTTFTVSAGVTGLVVDAWGAGGGGAGASTGAYGPGSGGGAGGYVHAAVTVKPLQQLTITIGTGGAAGTSGATGTDGAPGGATTLSADTAVLTSAGGGGGGRVPDANGLALGGAGGTGTVPGDTAAGGGGYLRAGGNGQPAFGGVGCTLGSGDYCLGGAGGRPFTLGGILPPEEAAGGNGAGLNKNIPTGPPTLSSPSTSDTVGHMIIQWSL